MNLLKKDSPSSDPVSIKTRFTYRFLMTLKKLKNNTPISSSPSMREKYNRYHKVKVAAYASMASAVGKRRKWSRVLLWRIRNRVSDRDLLKGISNGSFTTRRRRRRRGGGLEYDEANELQNLVPGGEEMDFCNLLDETAHYMKCLSMQVEIMTNILNLSSN